jgi:hypothetical protein
MADLSVFHRSDYHLSNQQSRYGIQFIINDPKVRPSPQFSNNITLSAIVRLQSPFKVFTVESVLYVASGPIRLRFSKIESDHLESKIDAGGDSSRSENSFINDDVTIPVHLNLGKRLFHHVQNGPVSSGTLSVKVPGAGEK